MGTETESAATEPLWKELSPVLDEALSALGETDRRAVLLRFFENKSLAEVAQALAVGEDGARKRVNRALERLHRYFRRRGISSTTALTAAAISAHSIQAAPAALAKSVTALAVAQGAAARVSTLALAKGVRNLWSGQKHRQPPLGWSSSAWRRSPSLSTPRTRGCAVKINRWPSNWKRYGATTTGCSTCWRKPTARRRLKPTHRMSCCGCAGRWPCCAARPMSWPPNSPGLAAPHPGASYQPRPSRPRLCRRNIRRPARAATRGIFEALSRGDSRQVLHRLRRAGRAQGKVR